MSTITKQQKKEARRRRVRSRVVGTQERPRLSVYKSNTRLIAQIIDDGSAKTLVSISSDKVKGDTPRARAEDAARVLAEAAKKAGITKVVFDRGGSLYAGSVKVFADAARAAGLDF